MNTLTDAPVLTSTLHDPQAARLASLLNDHAWGLARAAQSPCLQELCFGMGEHYEAVAQGRQPARGLAALIPMLLADCRAELEEHHAKPQDYKALLAARLLWAAPTLGERGLRIAHKAWLRVWRRQAGAQAHLRSLLN